VNNTLKDMLGFTPATITRTWERNV
jgi:hypothetical protein